jgi:hypothetical protein
LASLDYASGFCLLGLPVFDDLDGESLRLEQPPLDDL